MRREGAQLDARPWLYGIATRLISRLRAWCEAEPAPAPSRLTSARDRLDAAMAREAGTALQ